MRLFIDTEFNGPELISMALVADDSRSFYEVLGCRKPEPWVRDNVVPRLFSFDGALMPNHEIPQAVFTSKLKEFLNRFDTVHVVADWPADIAFLCNEIITGPGLRMNTPPLTFEVVRLDGDSDLPHNALADAIGLREAVWRHEQDTAVEDACGNLYTMDEWETEMKYLACMPSDGSGYWSTASRFSHSYSAFGEPPAWATHVMWFNK